MARIFITGAAGFIGFHLSQLLLGQGHVVHGFDSLNAYYDVALKKARLNQLKEQENFAFTHALLEDETALNKAADVAKPDVIVHLAAQAGVRYSLENPRAYIDSNVVGAFNVMEVARKHRVNHLMMASTSSVYGAIPEMPFRETTKADAPMTIYAATKKAAEAMGHSYAHLHNIPTTMFRFFTVYGPWGRPDMAYMLFTKAILEDEPIKVFNYGKHNRDFTYVDDIVEGVINAAEHIPAGNPDWAPKNPDPSSSPAPFRVYNIGNNSPVKLEDFILAMENALGKKAIREELPLQPGDVPDTWADCGDLEKDFGYTPSTPVGEGINKFIAWYREYYDV